MAAGFLRLVPGLDFKSSVERVATFQAGSIPVPRRQGFFIWMKNPYGTLAVE